MAPPPSAATPGQDGPSGRLEAVGLGKTYGRGPFAKEVVRDCSFTVEPGLITVMIGPSGVGKSTLIRLLAGFDRPSRGSILVDGRPVTGPGPDRLVMFQETALFPWMTTRDNVLYGPQARGELSGPVRERAARLLDKVGLQGFGAHYPGQLSGGMQRRAELARAMVNQPKVMMLDEPFRGLDALTRGLMLDYFASLCGELSRTILFVTTDIDEAIFLADRILVMSNVPTRVRAVLDVPLPRPRALSAVIDDDGANAIKSQALALLHEEALKSFAQGNRAANDFVEAYRRRHAAPSSTEHSP